MSHVVIIGPGGRKKVISAREARVQLRKQKAKSAKAFHDAMDAGVKASAEEALEILPERTKAGKDYRRRKFGNYSAKYAKEKGVKQTDVTLTTKGEFLDSLKVTKIKHGEYKLAFTGTKMQKRAKGLARGNWPLWGKRVSGFQRPKRRVMGIDNKEDQQRVGKAGFRAYQKTIRQRLKF